MPIVSLALESSMPMTSPAWIGIRTFVVVVCAPLPATGALVETPVYVPSPFGRKTRSLCRPVP